MDITRTIVRELDDLIRRGQPIAESYKISGISVTPISDVPEWTIREFVTAGAAAIDRISGRDSQYYRQMVLNPTQPLASSAEVVMSTLASLRALRDAVKKGHLLTLTQLAQAAVLDDFLLQSRMLLDARYHVAAMVLIGGVLEEHLKKLVSNRGLKFSGKAGLSAYNDALQHVVLDQPTWRRIQAVTDLRNFAAHGQGAKVKAEEVSDALSFVQRLLVDKPK